MVASAPHASYHPPFEAADLTVTLSSPAPQNPPRPVFLKGLLVGSAARRSLAGLARRPWPVAPGRRRAGVVVSPPVLPCLLAIICCFDLYRPPPVSIPFFFYSYF